MDNVEFTTTQQGEMEAMDKVRKYLGPDAYIVYDEAHKPADLPPEISEAWDYVVKRQTEVASAGIRE